MDAAKELQVLAHVQAVSLHYLAWRGELSNLVTLICFSMKTDAPPPPEIERFLRRESTAEILAQRYEVALWRDTRKQYHLVSLTVPNDIAKVKRRLNEKPASCSQCSWCWQDAGKLADIELIPERDLSGNTVPSRYLHPQCQRPWLQMRAMLAREGESQS